MGVDEMPHAATLRMRQQEPVALYNLVGSVLSPDVVASVLVQDQGRTLAGCGFSFEFQADTFVIAGETVAGLGWRQKFGV